MNYDRRQKYPLVLVIGENSVDLALKLESASSTTEQSPIIRHTYTTELLRLDKAQ